MTQNDFVLRTSSYDVYFSLSQEIPHSVSQTRKAQDWSFPLDISWHALLHLPSLEEREAKDTESIRRSLLGCILCKTRHRFARRDRSSVHLYMLHTSSWCVVNHQPACENHWIIRDMNFKQQTIRVLCEVIWICMDLHDMNGTHGTIML